MLGIDLILSGDNAVVIALVVAVVSFVVLQRFKVPIYLMVPAGAIVGMGWTLVYSKPISISAGQL